MQERNDEEEGLQAEITDIIREKRPYAVARPVSRSGRRSRTSITFSLDLWKGRTPPEVGQVVVLGDIVKHRRGWRARVARPVIASSR